MPVDLSGRVYVIGSVPVLHPEAQTVNEMLEGWRNQQLCRNLDADTVAGRARLVERFIAHTNEFPWTWTPTMVGEFFSDLRSVKRGKQSTVRGYQNALRMFCSYVSDPDYGWDRVCEQRFGNHPAQVFFEWNTATHVQDNEQSPVKRAFTKHELQDFFDHADDRVAVIAASARKGWLPAYRDATMFKVAYAYGLRFNELRHLQTVDFSRNAHAGEFGRHGVVQVRYGKAKKGSPPKRRGVLTVFSWTPEVITDWLAHGQACMGAGLDLLPSERGTLVAENTLLRRFRRYCRDLDLPEGLDLHSLRRSYATHLIEDGWDAKFVQDQMGHDHASTASLYTCVSSDYRVSTLRRALDGTIAKRTIVQPGEFMKRQVDYTWRLAKLMAARGMHTSTQLIPLLLERGIQLSRPQVYRVVHQRPERISLQMLAALCDILGCGVEDLVTVTASDVRRRKASSGPQAPAKPNVVELNKAVRPRRAWVIDDDD